jgi:diguanylate cyclase (GGDEF)-like protein
MNKLIPQIINEAEENKQNARILSILIWVSWVGYLVVMVSSLYYGDWKLIIITFASSVLLIIPIWLQKRGHLFLSGLFIVMIVLANITILATIGQGIHDFVILTYPIIIIFACITLGRVYFKISVFLTFVSIAWLVFGEATGKFISQTYQTPNWVDFVIISSILSVTVFATDILVKNMRRNLALAKEEIAQRKLIEEQLRYLSTYDVMTGIYNRNFFETELVRLELSREFPITIVIADVDGLKNINDTMGHTVGDGHLRETASLLRQVFRGGDILARIGGDEFAALLPSTDSETAAQLVSRIQENLVKHNLLNSKKPVMLSIGVATAQEKNLAEAFTLADHRMYMEKATKKTNTL